MEVLETINLDSFNIEPSTQMQIQAIQALESGKVVFMPSLNFLLQAQDKSFLSPDICDGNSKNVSYDINSDKLSGTSRMSDSQLKEFMRRYAVNARQLMDSLFPNYKLHIQQARTSYRPVEIAGRKAASYRKDDTLLHIDAFPATPVQGRRILRVFTNINPNGDPRVWRVGEDLNAVITKFAPKIKAPLFGSASLQKLLKITKGYRTAYDHYMLNIHNTMKADQSYQKNVAQQEVRFPAGATWIVYTDQVSHAAMAGQYVLEQTFYLPVTGLKDEQSAPLRVLEKTLDAALI